MDLPSEVQVVRAKGRTYYYWVPNRNTPRQGERLPLPRDAQSPEFWAKIRALAGSAPGCPPGSVADIVTRYRASEDFLGLAESSRTTYGVHLDRFARPDGWGHLPAKQLTAFAVQLLRDQMKATPVMANQMLDVGTTLYAWAIPLGLVGAIANPFEPVKDLRVPERGHVPWPEWVRAYVLEKAPQDLVRMVRLGLMTCQRESDLVRFGPEHREDIGLWCRPKKTRRKRRAFRVPLATVDAFELDRWATSPITFENTRWTAPIAKYRADLYLYTPRGAPYTPERLRARWGRWLTRTDAGKALVKRWRAWLAEQVKRYEWDIDPEDSRGPTIHGLRGAGVLIRLGQGYDPQAISNDIGMSLQMVQHYTRFRDQIDMADQNRRRLEVITGGAG